MSTRLPEDPMERIKSKILVDKNGCWNWLYGKDKDGYGKITFKYKSYRTHRLVYENIYGEIPKGKLVLHKCDNKSCCNPEHLFLGTQKDNVHDCIKKGRFKPFQFENYDHLKGANHYLNKYPEKRKLGEDCPFSKLNEEKVNEIRNMHKKDKISSYRLAKIFNVSKFCILSIVNRKTWRHI